MTWLRKNDEVVGNRNRHAITALLMIFAHYFSAIYNFSGTTVPNGISFKIGDRLTVEAANGDSHFFRLS